MQLRRTAACVAVLTTVVLGGCGGDGDDSSSEGPAVENVTQEAKVSIKVTGSRMLEFEGTTVLRILKAKGPGDVNVLVVGTDKGVEVGDGATMEAYVQLTNFGANGSYVAPATSGSSPSKLENSAYVQYVRRPPSGDADVIRWDLVRKECRFEIKKEGSEGSASCPALESNAGDQVELRMEWKGSGKRVPVPIPPQPTDGSTPSTSSSIP